MCCVFCLFPHELSSKLLSVCSYDCPKYSLPTEETQLSLPFDHCGHVMKFHEMRLYWMQ